MSQPQQPQQRQQGVLYKRRDVFKNHWRPRYFVLEPNNGCLTYYLQDIGSASSSTDINSTVHETSTASSNSPRSPINSPHMKSATPQNDVTYNVVPRGTIYLRECAVEIDSVHSRPFEHLYAFTIIHTSTENSNQPCFLAASTEQDRTIWVQHLSRVARTQTFFFARSPAPDTREQQQQQRIQPISREHSGPLVALEQTSPTSATTHNTTKPCAANSLLWKDDHSQDCHDGAISSDNAASNSALLQNLPQPLETRIQQMLHTMLPLIIKHRSEDNWTDMFQNKEGVAAFSRQHLHENNEYTMMKTTALVQHHPKQIFNLLNDYQRRVHYETNVRTTARLKRYNSHTVLEYHTYRPVWPTSARDFLAVAHWRVILLQNEGNGDDNDGIKTNPPLFHRKAICLMGFSYSDQETKQLQPPVPNHVRGNLVVSMYVLEHVQETACRITRVLSYDLGGSVPQSLTKTIIFQQAMMPAILARHLLKTEPTPADSLANGKLSNQAVVKHVIAVTNDNTMVDNNNGIEQEKREKLAKCSEKLIVVHGEQQEIQQTGSGQLSVLATAIMLLNPLILLHITFVLGIPGREIIFVIAAFISLRVIVLANVGSPCATGRAQETVGHVTCRFAVELKGVLRFVANKKEEREERESSSVEISVVHIVMKAVTQALSEFNVLTCQKTSIPLLGVDAYFRPKDNHINISLVSGGKDGAPDDVFTLNNAGLMTIQDIANSIPARGTSTFLSGRTIRASRMTRLTQLFTAPFARRKGTLGSCIVLVTPDDTDHCQVQMDVSPPQKYSDVNVSVVVGGVRRIEDKRKSTSLRTTTTKPVISLSLTISCPACNIVTSQHFAERVQKLVQFPEMCED